MTQHRNGTSFRFVPPLEQKVLVGTTDVVRHRILFVFSTPFVPLFVLPRSDSFPSKFVGVCHDSPFFCRYHLPLPFSFFTTSFRSYTAPHLLTSLLVCVALRDLDSPSPFLLKNLVRLTSFPDRPSVLPVPHPSSIGSNYSSPLRSTRGRPVRHCTVVPGSSAGRESSSQ